MQKQNAAQLEIVSGWKDIANYLGKGVRTVQRYERELGLPVRRPSGKPMGSVIATKAELDGWVTASPIREVFRLALPAGDNSELLTEFRWNVRELHRLREETKALRHEVSASLNLLRSNLDASFTEGLHAQEPKPSLPTNMLPSDPMRKRVN